MVHPFHVVEEKTQKSLSFCKYFCADVLAASDRGSYFDQEKLIALDEEYERCLQYVRGLAK